MDGMLFNPKPWLSLGLLAALAAGGAGCQTAQPVSVNRLLNYQAMIDFSGLKSADQYDSVKAQVAPPQSWKELVPKRGTMFTDMQWRSPSGKTAMGVAHVRMPLPFSPRTLLWFAKGQYAKQSDDGRLLGQWVDELGRSWFEAENKKYHVRGFIITKGFEAWIIYTGYKMTEPTDMSELALGARSMETIVPMANGRRSVASVERD